MKLVVIGTGYVGLVSGACFAEMGHDVVCVDKDSGKIKALKDGIIPIYEPALEDVVMKNVQQGRLSFTTSLKEALKGAEAALLAVGTPTEESNGRADLSYVFAATKEIAQNIEDNIVVITKSTVPVGTGQKILNILKEERHDVACEVASNPEFLREGSAVSDFMHPDRVIIGAESERTQNLMQQLYTKMIGAGVPVLFTNIATAELIKYASNAFLAMKIAYVNEVADICEGVGADIDLVIKGMGMDKRIGNKYMQPGPGYGGSCFPKDTKIAKDVRYPISIIEAVIKSNDYRKTNMTKKIVKACQGDVFGKQIAILGLTFKANTDDMRYSASLVIIPELIKQGALIKVYDPVGMKEAKRILQQKEITWCNSAEDAIKNSTALVILTEWDEFKELNLHKTKELLSGNTLVDLRNLFDVEKVKNSGLCYIAIGK